MERLEPDYDGGCIANFSASLLREFGVGNGYMPCREEIIPVDSLSSNRIVLLICDALGALQLEQILPSRRLPNILHLIEQAGGMRTLTSVFPSTTAAALTSFHSALPPCRHGILGYTLWIEEMQAVCEMLSFQTKGEASPRSLPIDMVRFGPTIHDLLKEVGAESHMLQPASILNSGLANLLHAGASVFGFRSRSEIPVLLKYSLENAKTKRSLHTIYWPTIDEFGHADGPMSEEYLSELEFLDFLLGKIMRICAEKDCLLILTADHGLTPLIPENRVSFSFSERQRMSCPPHGDSRVAYLRGHDLSTALTASDGEEAGYDLIRGCDAESAGWFGGECGRFRSRVPDMIALAKRTWHFILDPADKDKIRRGGHGGSAPEEMLVPLLIAAPDR